MVLFMWEKKIPYPNYKNKIKKICFLKKEKKFEKMIH